MQEGHCHDNLDWYLAIFTQCYYKLRQLISLQSATTCYYKVRQLNLLQSPSTCYYKVRQLFYYKVQQVLQSAMVITKCDRTPLPSWVRPCLPQFLLGYVCIKSPEKINNLSKLLNFIGLENKK